MEIAFLQYSILISIGLLSYIKAQAKEENPVDTDERQKRPFAHLKPIERKADDMEPS